MKGRTMKIVIDMDEMQEAMAAWVISQYGVEVKSGQITIEDGEDGIECKVEGLKMLRKNPPEKAV
jgi:hypothetical protein